MLLWDVVKILQQLLFVFCFLFFVLFCFVLFLFLFFSFLINNPTGKTSNKRREPVLKRFGLSNLSYLSKSKCVWKRQKMTVRLSHRFAT